MRKIIFFSLIIASISIFSARAQDRIKIEGSGNIITKEINVQSFDQLEVSGVLSLKLSQGNKEEVKIEADDNLQDLFVVKNEGSTLTIEMKKDVNYTSKKKVQVYITFKKLKSMDLKTVGDISSEQNLSFADLRIDNKSVGSIDLKLTAQSVNIENKSVGDVKLNGKADNATIINKSVGNIKAADFVVQKMDINNSGVGSTEVNAEKELKVRDSFLGKVKNKGAATIKRYNRQVI
jgi:hypothetical protein